TTELSWEIPIPHNAEKAIHLRLGEIGPYMIINPCSSNRARNWRNWSAERYASIIDHAQTAYGLNTTLSGGPSPRELNYAEQISSLCTHKPQNLVGQTKLKELAALCRGAKIMLAPDTGPAHIANAMGTPVIGLYASSNPDRTGPYGQQKITVNAYPEALRRELNKTVTEVKWGQRVRNPQIMELIEIEQVRAKMRQCLLPLQKASSHK
ncbi:MAG: glycosyltransferase family 9 protein, partial [Geopsychrobacter sp.]|nr:glycosyltransferase family 9 protein [Geopsychrobacter sp.]